MRLELSSVPPIAPRSSNGRYTQSCPTCNPEGIHAIPKLPCLRLGKSSSTILGGFWFQLTFQDGTSHETYCKRWKVASKKLSRSHKIPPTNSHEVPKKVHWKTQKDPLESIQKPYENPMKTATAGGYNDRQDIATRDKRAAEAENGYDDAWQIGVVCHRKTIGKWRETMGKWWLNPRKIVI